MLSMHFTKLTIVWSCSPTATAEIFSDLKHRQDDPDRDTCQRIGVEDESSLNCEFNPAPQEVLKNLPGLA
jgi:DNA excision repair protein ERCC-4